MFGCTRNVTEMEKALVAKESQIAELRIEQVVLIKGLDNGVPVVTSQSSRAIPLAIRYAVAHRDGGCTVDGCSSRYRLEPHHIRPRSHGGDHSIDNLTTLCWYHHHFAIHRDGYVLDEDSPPGRRTLKRPLAEPRAGPY